MADGPENGGGSTLGRWIGLFAGLAFGLVPLLVAAPEGMSPSGWRVAGIALMMAAWWMTEAVPVAATALLPLAAFPVIGFAPVGRIAAPYAHPLIFLFMGGFMIALAVERWNLHRRIALNILRAAGATPARLIGAFMVATAVLSMWVSNTATTVMMLPIALSVIAMVRRGTAGADPASAAGDGFAAALLLGTAYAASIGGLATLIGTPPNALLAAFLAERYGTPVGFAQWMLVGLPLSVAMLATTWWLLTRFLFPLPGGALPGAAEAVAREHAGLGPMTAPEKAVAGVFALTAACWMLRPLLNAELGGEILSDAGIAITGALILFVLPAGENRRLLDWDWAVRLPWRVLLLFGGGLSLAGAINDSGLAQWIGVAMEGFSTWPVVLVVVTLTAIVVFLTELTSNTATAATFLPLAAALAPAVGVAPQMLVVPAALAASCAFMLPVATPPNAIVFGSNMVGIPQMMRAGFGLNLVAIVLITATAYTLVALVLRPG